MSGGRWEIEPVVESEAEAAGSYLEGSDGAELEFRIHKVARSDTLAGVAVRYGARISDIKQLNGLHSDTAMWGRTSLVIPTQPLNPELMNAYLHRERFSRISTEWTRSTSSSNLASSSSADDLYSWMSMSPTASPSGSSTVSGEVMNPLVDSPRSQAGRDIELAVFKMGLESRTESSGSEMSLPSPLPSNLYSLSKGGGLFKLGSGRTSPRSTLPRGQRMSSDGFSDVFLEKLTRMFNPS